MIISTGIWQIDATPALDGWQFGPSLRCNEAAMIDLLKRRSANARMTAEERERERKRCGLGHPWQCPYPYPVCTVQHGRAEAVIIYASHFRDGLISVGQMSLWEPSVTHKRIWRSVLTGAVLDQAERPFMAVQPGCKKMGVAIMEWLKRHGWERALAWRILPVQKRQRRHWAVEMQERYPSVRPCVFETL